jgi:hypothetical protein
MPIGFDLFSNVRLTAVLNGFTDPRQMPGQFEFSRRVPTRRATDNEITARFIQYPQVADLIADDQRAVVYNTGKFQLSTTKVPNLKIGANVTQTQLVQLQAIAANPGSADADFFRDWESNTLYNLRLGIQQRIELMLVSMMTDSFVYDRLGLKVSASWGMPSDLKVTPATAWDNPAATPITDILTLKRLAQVKYGVILNRLTMSLAAFNYMIATTEFANKAKVFFPQGIALVTNVSTENTDDMLRLAERVLGNGIRIVLYDAMYFSQNEAGVTSMFPFLPITKVIFDSTANDGNGQVWDLANTLVTEPLVASIQGNPIGAANQVGPISYVTGVPNLNPPQLTYWAVQRCFPRKHYLQANAVLTVGAFVDPIPSVVPF